MKMNSMMLGGDVIINHARTETCNIFITVKQKESQLQSLSEVTKVLISGGWSFQK